MSSIFRILPCSSSTNSIALRVDRRKVLASSTCCSRSTLRARISASRSLHCLTSSGLCFASAKRAFCSCRGLEKVSFQEAEQREHTLDLFIILVYIKHGRKGADAQSVEGCYTVGSGRALKGILSNVSGDKRCSALDSCRVTVLDVMTSRGVA